ncbi:diaminopimelate epimerase [Eubacterium sp. 1001713B170207_170306_E7]|uniref:diaminopimelate epimerase n=1 Tax=Eubacterium sp. 1001713B170207_170306_E7 TaxID=2787097 RepID=UPI00189C1A1D|nr:diaminopimelate epimerase [Eubacterium sp. 1001713B170207_170306_E7]
MNFTKMQGAGNDFIVIDNMDMSIELPAQLIEAMCRPHFGIGADGLILVEPSKSCDVRMNYYNQDGSVAEMCGNGVRCLAKYAADAGLVDASKPFEVETRAGKIGVQVLESYRGVSTIKVSMGNVSFEPRDIPVVSDKAALIGEKITYNGQELTYGCASMGNPHMAVLVNSVDSFPIEEVGPYFEKHPMFPNKCNISFAEVLGPDSIAMDTWERGVGRTLACGTGTCATVAVLNRMGLVGNKVQACLSGGDLVIELDGNAVFMTGPAKVVFTGVYEMQVPDAEEALFAALREL